MVFIQRSLLLVRPVAARHSSRPTLVCGQCSSAGVGLPPRRWRMGQTVRGVRWRAQETLCGRIRRDLRFASRQNPHVPKNRLPAVRIQGRTHHRGGTRTQHAATISHLSRGSLHPAIGTPSTRIMAPDNPLTCAEKLAAAHESATLLQASWKVADIVDGALEGAVATSLEDASRHPVAEAAAAELLGASAARHGVEARPWLLRPPHAAKHERNAVLRACDQNVKRTLAAKLGTDEKYGEARAALAPALRVAYERHGVLSSKDVDESAPKHVRSLWSSWTAAASARAGGVA